MSDSLQQHRLQHARLPCPSPSPKVCTHSCPLNPWCHPNISASVVPFSSCPQPFPASGSILDEWALHIRWPKYWSFSINPSSEYSGFTKQNVKQLPSKSFLQGIKEKINFPKCRKLEVHSFAKLAVLCKPHSQLHLPFSIFPFLLTHRPS